MQRKHFSSIPSSMLPLPAQVHLPWLRELFLDKCLHCLAQVLAWLPSPSLAAFAFCLNVQQVAKAGTGLGHLEQEQTLHQAQHTDTDTATLRTVPQRAVSLKRSEERHLLFDYGKGVWVSTGTALCSSYKLLVIELANSSLFSHLIPATRMSPLK